MTPSPDPVEVEADVPAVAVSQRSRQEQRQRPQHAAHDGVADVGPHGVAPVLRGVELVQVHAPHVHGIKASITLRRIVRNLEAFLFLDVVQPTESNNDYITLELIAQNSQSEGLYLKVQQRRATEESATVYNDLA